MPYYAKGSKTLPRKKKFGGKIYKIEIGGYASKGRAKEVAREDYRSKGHNARVVKQVMYREVSKPYTWTNAKIGEKRRGTKRVKVPEVSYHVYYKKKPKRKTKKK